MNTDEKIDYAIKLLLGVDLRLAALEKLAQGYTPTVPAAPDTPKQPALLADFIRPFPVEPRHGAGTRMSAPDVNEFILRAKFAVRWNGDVMVLGEEGAWAEINALKAGDPLITKVYADTGIDPTLAAVLLLTGYLDPVQYDQYSLGIAQNARRDIVVKYPSPQAWIDEQFAILRGNPVVSGGDAPE